MKVASPESFRGWNAVKERPGRKIDATSRVMEYKSFGVLECCTSGELHSVRARFGDFVVRCDTISTIHVSQ